VKPELSISEPASAQAATPSAAALQNQLQAYGQQLISAADADLPELGQLHQQLGETHDDLARYAEAEIHYRAAAHCFEAANLIAQAALSYLTSGELQAQLGDRNRALKLFGLALSMGESLSDESIQARAIYSLGRLKEDAGDLESALSDYQQAERLIGQAASTDEVLKAAILSSISAVQIEIIVQQALRLAERLNRSFEESLESAPIDPTDPSGGDSSGITPDSPIELPIETRASRLPRPRPPRWR
jgi:tetratricopeptide (TPR) repeat protein